MILELEEFLHMMMHKFKLSINVKIDLKLIFYQKLSK